MPGIDVISSTYAARGKRNAGSDLRRQFNKDKIMAGFLHKHMLPETKKMQEGQLTTSST
jgi:hypothetical protein